MTFIITHMKIDDIFKLDRPSEAIEELKSKRGRAMPDVDKAAKQLDPLRHDVFNKALRPDKKVKIDQEDVNVTKVITSTEAEAGYRYEPVARVAVALQKLIVKRAVAFLFGNPVELNAEPQNDKQKQVLTAVSRILHDVKSKSLNRKVGRQAMSCMEVAELWYPVEKVHGNYGFRSKFKLRAAVFSPLLGDELYPYFDESGDMTAFSR